MITSRRTLITVLCRSRDTKWTVVINSSGLHNITTRRRRRLGCPIQDSHHTTDWVTINKWNRMDIGPIVHHRWVIWVRNRMDMALMVTNHRLQRSTLRRAKYKQLPRWRAVSLGALHWNRPSKCLTTCIPSSTWPSTGCRRISSTSCIPWTTCSTRRRCLPCISSRCTHSRHLLNNHRQIPMRRYQVRSTLG